tara:strand:+ start:1215 stop:2291 length:1077 start_codon:yes stop_codon:yes gene_type:complete
MLKETQIFIHVPKTGGTTLNATLHNSKTPQDTSFNYRHIVSGTQLSNSGDIFNPLKYDKYQSYKIFMLLRHPVDRILSEYYFIKERDMFFSKLNPKPKNFEEYALHRQTANYVVSFLLGNEIYAKKRPSTEDLDLVINGIKNLNITVGIFEHFQKSLDLFQKEVGIKWPKTIHNKRVTIIRPERETVSEKLAEKILKHHNLDLALYNYAKSNFDVIDGLSPNVVKFIENQYDYILTYTKNRFVLDMVMKDHPFLRCHQQYFNDLRRFLSIHKPQNGQDYLEKWQEAFVAALNENNLSQGLVQIINKSKKQHPTLFIKSFGSYINSTSNKEWQNIKLKFDRSKVPQKHLLSRISRFFRL